MTLLHVRLNGHQTQINLPSTIQMAGLRLKSYRVLMNRVNHGYYHVRVTSSLLMSGNMMAFTAKNQANLYAPDLPLFINPELKLTQEHCDWDLGTIQNSTSTVTFTVQMYSCIERKRFDQAVFETTDANVLSLGVDPRFGFKVPIYKYPQNINLTCPQASTDGKTYYEELGSIDANGNQLAPNPSPGTAYPSYRVYVHTGVQIGDNDNANDLGIDPTPGGTEYTTDPINGQELQAYNQAHSYPTPYDYTGSGFRKGAIPYPYSIDLVFELY